MEGGGSWSQTPQCWESKEGVRAASGAGLCVGLRMRNSAQLPVLGFQTLKLCILNPALLCTLRHLWLTEHYQEWVLPKVPDPVVVKLSSPRILPLFWTTNLSPIRQGQTINNRSQTF